MSLLGYPKCKKQKAMLPFPTAFHSQNASALWIIFFSIEPMHFGILYGQGAVKYSYYAKVFNEEFNLQESNVTSL